MSLLDDERLNAIQEYLAEVDGLAGDVAEVGVYKGGSASLICSRVPKKHVLLFDTFEGMPEVKPIDDHKQGDFADTSLREAVTCLGSAVNYEVHRGIFPRQTSEYAEFRQFCFVHLDVDIYDSVKECLEFFYPRMVEGGIIVIDDYNAPMCHGAKLALDEFLADKPEEIERYVSCSVMFRKKISQ